VLAQVLAAMVREALLKRGCPWFAGDNEGSHLLSIEVVWATNDGGFEHGRMRQQDLLDLAWRNAFPAANDDVTQAPDEIEKAIGVLVAEIARAEPTTLKRIAFLAARIGRGNAWTDNANFARFSWWDILQAAHTIKGSTDTEVYADWFANRPWYMPFWRKWVGTDLTGRFSEAVCLDDWDAKLALELEELEGWQGSRSGAHKAKRAGSRCGVIGLEQQRQNSRDDTCPGNMVLFYPWPKATSAETRGDDYRAAS